MNFGSEQMLISRLLSGFNQKKQFTFLLGSGCTLSNNSSIRGVSSVSEIVSQIKLQFEADNQVDLLLNALKTGIDSGNEYQIAMNTLLQCYGQDDVNKVIVNAVLNARKTGVVYSDKTDATNDLEEIEKDLSGWNIRESMDALGSLLVKHPKIFKSPILTTNFDPLIEIGIVKNKGLYNPTGLTNDGNILNTASSSIIQVIHLHGFWRHGDTLHSPYQLTKERPLLKGDLRKLLNNTILVVLGYGGWGDVFTNTLIEVITEGGNECNVLWTFYDNDEKHVTTKNDLLLDKLKNSLDQRVVLYKGIDFNKIMPNLKELIDGKSSKTFSPSADISITENTILLNIENNLSNKVITAYDCDSPPSNSNWVGRKNELELLDKSNFKACFITGIGGQGKSGLAAHFVSTHLSETYWDWRDCKEEDNRFITILIGLVERLTNGKFRSYQLIKEPISSIIDLFFKELGDREAVFIFDNIDNYIDLVDFYPTRGIKVLLEKILSVNHKSKFIFTCRPEINSHSPQTTQIILNDLSLVETKELFRNINCPLKTVDKEEVAQKAHDLTHGHPLWLNLIAAQLFKGKEIVNKFIDDIKNSKSSDIQNPSTILAVNTLNIVWKNLNPKQQSFMRGLAETVVAETERHLRRIMESEFNENQFYKAFNAVKKLNLVVIKSPTFSAELYELHPLVKEFIIYKFEKKERNKYITMFVNFYDQIILLVKKAPEPTDPLSLFQNWTNKIELEVNKENYQSALTTLHQISETIITAGYIEEYQRVATKFFIEVDFNEALSNEFPYFEEQVKTFAISLSEIGKFSEAEAYLNKFSKCIAVKGVQYITLCNTYAYHYWCKKEFSLAIEFAEKALNLINNSNVIIGPNASHNLALALRDSGDKSNLLKALNIFTNGESIDMLYANLDTADTEMGSYYGNIGRCLWLLDKKDQAIEFYKKSFKCLKDEMYANSQINRGYACSWLAESFLEQNQLVDSYCFFRLALKYWQTVSPLKKIDLEKQYARKFKSINPKVLNYSDWEIEKFCFKLLGLK